MNLSPDIDFDLTVRGVAALANPAVSGYSTADLRLAWRPSAGVELALLARNLGDGGHGEVASIATRTEIRRGGYATVRRDFRTRSSSPPSSRRPSARRPRRGRPRG